MTTTKIPEKITVTCDCCGKDCGTGTLHRRQEGRLILKQHALDYQGSPCADGSITRDLCDDCLYAVGKAVNAVCEARRAEVRGLPAPKEPTP